MKKDLEAERIAIKALLDCPARFDIGLDGSLYIRHLESGQWAVGDWGEMPHEGLPEGRKGWEKLFEPDQQAEAIDRFLKERHEKEYGMDYDIFYNTPPYPPYPST